MAQQPHIVVVGGGFGGLECVRHLAKADARITLVDRTNHHVFQPLLYEVATGALEPADIARPLRELVRRQDNVEVVLAEVDDVDLEGGRIHAGESWVPYDTLVLAAGATDSFFGHDDWARHAIRMKTLDHATDLRERILLAFERAEWEADEAERAHLTTFVIVGGGPTGTELAGALREIACQTLQPELRHLDACAVRVILVEALDHVLPAYPEDVGRDARRQLEALGVEVREKSKVIGIDARGITLEDGRIEAANVIWAAGVEAAPLGRRMEVERDRKGRVRVTEDLSVPGHPDVYVIGDLAWFEQDGRPLPGLAPVAKQMGRHVARNVLADLRGRTRKAFRYRDRGTTATIGRRRAVAVIGGLHLSGLVAWLVWALVHIWTLVGFENRLVVMIRWLASWVTRGRPSRIITERPPPRETLDYLEEAPPGP